MGSITASCGHKLADDEDIVPVIYRGETGFEPCVVYASFCPACAGEWAARGELFDTQAEADAWLDSAVQE